MKLLIISKKIFEKLQDAYSRVWNSLVPKLLFAEQDKKCSLGMRLGIAATIIYVIMEFRHQYCVCVGCVCAPCVCVSSCVCVRPCVS